MPGGWPAVRLLGVEEMATLPAPTWLIKDVLPGDAMSMLYGQTRSGKSFWALDWALSVATGTTWAGRSVKQGPVVYIAAEGAGGYMSRRQAWERHRGVRVKDSFYLVQEAINLYQPGHVEVLLKAMRGLGKTALVVVDTLGRCMDGADENDNGHMNVVIGQADRIRRETGAAVLLVHHTGKGGGDERGASALRAGVAMAAKLENRGSALTLTCKKMKDGPEFDPLTGVLAEVTLGGGTSSLVVTDHARADDQRSDPKTTRGAVKPPSPEKPRLKAEDVLAAVATSPGITPAAAAERLGVKRNVVQQHLRRLVDEGRIVKDSQGLYRVMAGRAA